MHILRPDDRRINIHARPDATRTAPMIDLPTRIRRETGDIAHNLRHRRSAVKIQGRQVCGQSVEEPADEGGDILRVLRVTVVDVAGRAREVVCSREHDFAGGFQARGAVDVHRDGCGVGVVLVAGGAEPALHAGDGAVGVGDGIPERARSAGEGVGPGFLGQVQVAVCGDWVVVYVVVGYKGWAGEFDEGVWVVEEACADSGVVDPGRRGEAAELVGLGELLVGGESALYVSDEAVPVRAALERSTYCCQNGRVTDPRLHQQLWRLQCATAENYSPCSR